MMYPWFASIMARLKRWPPKPYEIDTAIVDDMEHSSRERLRASTCALVEAADRTLEKIKPALRNGFKHHP